MLKSGGAKSLNRIDLHGKNLIPMEKLYNLWWPWPPVPMPMCLHMQNIHQLIFLFKVQHDYYYKLSYCKLWVITVTNP